MTIPAALARLLPHVPMDALLPLAVEVLAGRMTRTDLEQAIPPIIDAMLAFGDGPIGTAAELVSDALLPLLSRVIAGMVIHQARPAGVSRVRPLPEAAVSPLTSP